jgi:hypothetical protein
VNNRYYRVVILRDLVNSIDEVAEALINHVPGLICSNRDWYRSRNMQYARKMAQLARVYGSAVVAESTDEKKAFEIYSYLLSRGLRLHPFGEAIPECEIDRTELTEISSDDTCRKDASKELAAPQNAIETSNDNGLKEQFHGSPA